MTKYTMDMVLEYSKVFEDNIDRGDAGSSAKWLRDLAKSGGQASVNAYFISEEQIAQLEADGFERMATNPNTGDSVDRIKEGNSEFGIGKYLVLKRKMEDKAEFKDRKTGEWVEVDFGGLPKVVDLRDMDNKKFWSVEEDGYIGNGSMAKVQFEVYNGRKVRLLAIGVTELVEWEEITPDEDSELFNV